MFVTLALIVLFLTSILLAPLWISVPLGIIFGLYFFVMGSLGWVVTLARMTGKWNPTQAELDSINPDKIVAAWFKERILPLLGVRHA